MTDELNDRTVLVIGRGSGIARAITETVRDAGARVIVAGRNKDALAAAYPGDPGIIAEYVDLTDEASIAALAERISPDHIVSTGSARARGKVADLDRDAIRKSFDTKVIGPLMLAKHFAPRMPPTGSFVIFSGVAATKIAVGTLGVAITNGSAEVLARSLALELAPIRVNAISSVPSSTRGHGTRSARGARPTTSPTSPRAIRPGASVRSRTSRAPYGSL